MPQNPTDQIMTDAIEHALWQDLADALDRIEAWGLDPIAGLAEKLGVTAIREIDAGPVIHGGGRREGGYLLRYQPPFTPAPERPGHDLPYGWQVTAR
jgi:hypothetical protein